MHRNAALTLVTVAGLTAGATALSAQTFRRTSLETIGSDADERARLAQLLGLAPGTGAATAYLLRAPSTRTPRLPGDSTSLRWAFVTPEYAAVENSGVPFSLNDGAMWAGRGWNQVLRGGVRAEWRRFSLTIAPEVLQSDNLAFNLPPPDVELPRPPDRSVYSSPWHIRPYSIDLPLQFGDRGFVHVDPGQSALAATLGRVTAGVSTENEWWGPGVRNAIVLSNNAPGIPRLFFRTTRPLRGRLGTLDARWFAGGLTQSDYFYNYPAHDLRSIAGLALTWSPGFEPDLTLGFTRAVYAPVSGWSRIPPRLFDVFRNWGRPTDTAPGDSSQIPGRDQIYSFFGRWVFPKDGFATYFEWARTAFPSGLRDLLILPNDGQGYTLGLEWARPTRVGRDAIRVQAEITYLEKGPAYRDRPQQTFYTSRRVVQGYTQQGQVIGAAIGPGSSSQWLAVDYVAPTWRVGVFGGRIRWDDDALYSFTPTTFVGSKYCSHDVSLFGGVSGATAGRWGKIAAAVSRAERLNPFFNHRTGCGPYQAPGDYLDVGNTTLIIRLSPPP